MTIFAYSICQMWMPFDDESELGDLIALNMANMMPF